VVLGQVFSQHFDFPCNSNPTECPKFIIYRPGLVRKPVKWPTYEVVSVSPHPKKLKNSTCRMTIQKYYITKRSEHSSNTPWHSEIQNTNYISPPLHSARAVQYPRSWLRQYVTRHKVADSSPDEVIGFSNLPNPSSLDAACNRNEYHESSGEVKDSGRVRLATLPPSVSRLSTKCGRLDVLLRAGKRRARVRRSRNSFRVASYGSISDTDWEVSCNQFQWTGTARNDRRTSRKRSSEQPLKVTHFL
jgi:hypothetical protein